MLVVIEQVKEAKSPIIQELTRDSIVNYCATLAASHKPYRTGRCLATLYTYSTEKKNKKTPSCIHRCEFKHLLCKYSIGDKKEQGPPNHLQLVHGESCHPRLPDPVNETTRRLTNKISICTYSLA